MGKRAMNPYTAIALQTLAAGEFKWGYAPGGEWMFNVHERIKAQTHE